ncbi:MAG: FixH family protein [bacterium]|nr:FixH family protein [bacterium]
MNWGTKITILYVGFMGLIITLMFISFGSKTELEYSDYYKRELNFQQQIDAANNANGLSTPIDYTISKQGLLISIPKELLSADLKGSIELLRPSDSNLDRSIPLHPDTAGKQWIKPEALKTGSYKLSVLVNNSKKQYYKEAYITIN